MSSKKNIQNTHSSVYFHTLCLFVSEDFSYQDVSAHNACVQTKTKFKKTYNRKRYQLGKFHCDIYQLFIHLNTVAFTAGIVAAPLSHHHPKGGGVLNQRTDPGAGRVLHVTHTEQHTVWSTRKQRCHREQLTHILISSSHSGKRTRLVSHCVIHLRHTLTHTFWLLVIGHTHALTHTIADIQHDNAEACYHMQTLYSVVFS